jgi:hypothetical protein
MTPYELLCDNRTARINDNLYDHWDGDRRVMYYMADDEFEKALFQLRVDLMVLEKRKK